MANHMTEQKFSPDDECNTRRVALPHSCVLTISPRQYDRAGGKSVSTLL